MAKKTLESSKILSILTITQLGALHELRGSKSFKDFVSVLNQVIINDKDKQVGLVSDLASVDDAVVKVSKQNFYRGRVSSLVLLHSLLINAEAELERREKSKK